MRNYALPLEFLLYRHCNDNYVLNFSFHKYRHFPFGMSVFGLHIHRLL